MATQLNLSKELKPRLEHGGSLAIGKRKTRRPVVTKRAMHTVLRVADGGPNLTRFSKGIHNILSTMGSRFGVQTYERAICGNHIHLAVRAKGRAGFLNFLRAIAGRIAQLVGACGSGNLWQSIPYTRIVEWGRHFRKLLHYVRQNALEAEGSIPYQPRGRRRPKKENSPAPGLDWGNGSPAGGRVSGRLSKPRCSRSLFGANGSQWVPEKMKMDRL